MTKNRTPTPVYLDPGMHPGLEVKGLMEIHVSEGIEVSDYKIWRSFPDRSTKKTWGPPARTCITAPLNMALVLFRSGSGLPIQRTRTNGELQTVAPDSYTCLTSAGFIVGTPDQH